MAACRDSDAPPEAFTRAVAELRAAEFRAEVQAEEAPSPQRVAPYAAALTADVVIDDEERGTGRLVLLHDPDGHEAWQGTFRCVTYVRADIDPETVTDPLLGSVAWSWLVEALDHHDAEFGTPSGTVTRMASESYGGMADDPARAEIELRASWTPPDEWVRPHVEAWGDMLCTAAGLPPLPPGVVAIPARRARS